MRITPNGTNYGEESFVTKMAQDMLQNMASNALSAQDFSATQDADHPIQVKKLGLFGKLPDGVDENMWVTQSGAQTLYNEALRNAQ